MIEVNKKKHHLAKLGAGELKKFMEEHPMPAVVGPEGKLYITDHHHLGRGALEAGVEVGCFQVEADLSHLAGDAMDDSGVRHRYDKIPHHLGGLVDDVYRSLAGYVREGGGYEKRPSAFEEFVWADFFRRLIAIEDVQADFDGAVKLGMSLARSDKAKRMPGYAGGA
jgi:hypothetical protein